MLSNLATIKSILSGDPVQAFQAEMQKNPQFASFVEEHKNMTVQDLLAQSGIDPGILTMLLK